MTAPSTLNQVARAKAAITTMEASFKALPSPAFASPKMTPGEILAIAAKSGSIDSSPSALMRTAVVIRRKMDTQLKSARDELERERAVGDGFMKVAEYLSGQRTILDAPALPQRVIDAARTVKRAAEAGVMQPRALADEIKRHATTGLLTVAEHGRTLLRVTSAAKTATANCAAREFAHRAKDTSYGIGDREHLRRIQRGYSKARDSLRNRHAKMWFEDKPRSVIQRMNADDGLGLEV